MDRLTLPVRLDPNSAEPLELARMQVVPSWIDYNGHMTEGRYLLACSEVTDVFLNAIGVDIGYVRAGRSYYTVETHIMHLDESHEGEQLVGTLQLLAADDKRLHVFVLFRVGERPVASIEQMLLHVDATAGKAMPADPGVLTKVYGIAETHASLPRPQNVGRFVGASRL
ncbi:MAG: thioesterase family protein [Pseudomonadota bacterium]